MGVDVGGVAKGFDVAVLDGATVVELAARCSRDRVLEMVKAFGPVAIGIDSPDSCAPPGKKSRAGERMLASEVCPIFYTPDEAIVFSGHPFYGWMREGLGLYAAIASAAPGTTVVEVFPSAAWTVWAGKRCGRGKPEWSRTALRRAGVGGVPQRCSQDARDAIGAAVVAGLHFAGETIRYGDIAVPRSGSVALAT